MTSARSPLAILLAGTLAAIPLAGLAEPAANSPAAPAAAAPAPVPAPKAAAQPSAQPAAPSASQDLVTTVDDALKAMREIRAARLALFDGNTGAAGPMVTAAAADMTAAQKAEKDYGIASKSGTPDTVYLPIETSIALAEGFTATPDTKGPVKAANDQMAKGNTRAAAETLKAANIDVAVSVALVPAGFALTHLTDAEALIKDGKYYEANLALKAVEDLVVVDTWSLADVPQQTGAKTDAKTGAKTG